MTEDGTAEGAGVEDAHDRGIHQTEQAGHVLSPSAVGAAWGSFIHARSRGAGEAGGGSESEVCAEDWPGWELLDYVASEAYELVTGDPYPCSEEFCAVVRARRGEHVASRGLAGERWNVRDEAEATRRLPRLSAMFLLCAGS